MDKDDNIRSEMGVTVCLRDMGNGQSRLFLDDVRNESARVPGPWQHDCFFTFTPEFDDEALSEMGLSDSEFMKIGELVVARLLAMNGRIK